MPLCTKNDRTSKMGMSTFDSQDAHLLDRVGRQILRLLQDNARLSFAEIGRRVGLTSPAVAERVRKMEEAGIITGFHAAVDPAKLGFSLIAYIHVTVNDGRYNPVQSLAMQQPTVTECYCIAGDRDVLIKGAFESIQHLQTLVNQLTRYGNVSTTLVLETRLARRSLG
jgi:Lrp/AsnC family transcriptional regulator, leucine-responsive regulatory protein